MDCKGASKEKCLDNLDKCKYITKTGCKAQAHCKRLVKADCALNRCAWTVGEGCGDAKRTSITNKGVMDVLGQFATPKTLARLGVANKELAAMYADAKKNRSNVRKAEKKATGFAYLLPILRYIKRNGQYINIEFSIKTNAKNDESFYFVKTSVYWSDKFVLRITDQEYKELFKANLPDAKATAMALNDYFEKNIWTRYQEMLIKYRKKVLRSILQFDWYVPKLDKDNKRKIASTHSSYVIDQNTKEFTTHPIFWNARWADKPLSDELHTKLEPYKEASKKFGEWYYAMSRAMRKKALEA